VPSGYGEEACIAEDNYFENPADGQARMDLINEIFMYITPQEQEQIIGNVPLLSDYETNGLPILTVDANGQHYFLGIPVTLAQEPPPPGNGGGSGTPPVAGPDTDMCGSDPATAVKWNPAIICRCAA
jgi:hypothetical protein